LSRPLANYDWRANLVSLVQDKPGLVPPQEAQFPSRSAYFRARSAYDASIAKYYLNFQSNGTFRVDDVPPGRYTLALCVTAPTADPLSEDALMNLGPVLGGITKIVVVPPIPSGQSDEALDLGTIRVPMEDSH
jgi:hypothetical protein